MAMMFNKLKNKENNTVTTTTDSGDNRGGYRTHLIFSGKRDADGGGINAGASQSSSSYYLGGHASSSFSSASTHPFGQAQFLKPSSQDKGRKGGNRPPGEDDLFRQSNKQVSFGGSGGSPMVFTATGGGLVGAAGLVSSGIGLPGPHHSALHGEEPGKPGMLEVVAGLSRDCFIIPLAYVERFLPAGLTLPEVKLKPSKSSKHPTGPHAGPPSTPLNVLEVADPQLAIVVHLMTPLLSMTPPRESPQGQAERVQRGLAMQLLQKAAGERQASHGLLLSSMETESDFPMISLYTVQQMRVDVNDFVETSRKSALDMFEPGNIGHCGDHFFHLCREVATIVRPPLDPTTTSANRGDGHAGNPASTGYIVSIFRVFEGDDREKMERNWLYWTGARTLYRHLPNSVGLRRITLHKSAALRGDKLYLLLCECANFVENVNSAAQLLPAMRARLCGYTGIYRVAAAF